MILQSLKTWALDGVIWVSGTAGGLLAFLFQPEDPKWYQHPGVVAAAVSALAVFGVKLYDNWRADSREEDSKRLTLSEVREKIIADSLERVMREKDRNHSQQIRFLQTQLIAEEITTFEHRIQKHASINEVNRSYGMIRGLQMMLASNGMPVPEFHFKSQDEIMEGTEEKVEKYKERLQMERLQQEGAVHSTPTQ